TIAARTLWTPPLTQLGLRVPESLHPEVAANGAQRAEWVRLFAIDEIKPGLDKSGYTEPLTAAFLKENPFLVLDTVFFPGDFQEKLLADNKILGGAASLDEATDGLLIHSENFQALNLLQTRFRERVQCTYIDPPYNTDASAICYKNGYKSSSWIALMASRLRLARPLLSRCGVLVAAIDDAQHRELSFLLSDTFDSNILGTICVRSNPSGRPTQAGYAVSHEYLLFAGKSSESVIGRLPPTQDQMARFNQSDAKGAYEWRNLRREGSDSDRNARRTMYYPIYIENETIRVPKMAWNVRDESWTIEESPGANEQVVYPNNEDGVEKRWRWEWTTVMGQLSELAVRKDRSGKDYIYYKRRPNEDGVVSVSSWFDAKHSATEHGTALLKALFGGNPFSYPKSIHAVVDSVYIAGAVAADALVLDFFGGSATTAHAVIHGKRKYVLVEMGEYFASVTKTRIQKVIYSKDWKDGKPVSREGSSHLFKYLRLESYEDALNNLEWKRTADQDDLLRQHEPLREDYMLRYQLDVETRDSASLLKLSQFTNPFAYQLKIATGSVGESRPVNVDLVETFNYLLGLRVSHMDTIRGFRVVQGLNPDGEKVLVIWRNVAEKPNAELDTFFQTQGYNTKDLEFALIYVNGDNNLENLKRADETWKVRRIEDEFKRLMFDVADV
ncbi:MAG: site-specific DNA-methyltransferase, partial [Verrucomicrobiota bacterium]